MNHDSIMAPGGVINECEGGMDALKKIYVYEQDEPNGWWALCPVCHCWYPAPLNIGAPYSHSVDGWLILNNEQTNVPFIVMTTNNIGIPEGVWTGVGKACDTQRMYGLAAGAVDPPQPHVDTQEIAGDSHPVDQDMWSKKLWRPPS